MCEKRIKELQKVSDEISQQCNILWEKQSKINEEIQHLRVQASKSKDVLRESVWDVGYTFSILEEKLSIYLTSSSNDFKKLSNVLETDYHCRHNLEPGVSLRFDDRQVSLHFDSGEIASDFIKEYHLRLNLDKLRKGEKQLMKQLDNLRRGLSDLEKEGASYDGRF